MDREPSGEELRAFVDSILSNLDSLLREPVVIEETIREHREMWVMLYRVSTEPGTSSIPPARAAPPR